MSHPHSKEKHFLAAAIKTACKDTIFQDNAELAAELFGNILANYVENRETIRKYLDLPSESERNKVVVNECYDGFGLSLEAFKAYHAFAEIPEPKDQYSKGDRLYNWFKNLDRDDPYLVRVVETLGEKANGANADLSVRYVTPGNWRIKDHDGYEQIVNTNE
jgi:hypothetical protein